MARRRYRDDDDWDRDFFDEFFEDFDIDIRKMNERMAKMFDELKKSPEARTFGPYVYGFTYRIGKDGKPSFQEFGNVPEMMQKRPEIGMEKGTREPLVDLNEDQEKFYVTYELPGINKKDIELKVTENGIILSAKDDQRHYYKKIDFEEKVDSESASARFVNGILDVTLSKLKKKEKEGKNVKID